MPERNLTPDASGTTWISESVSAAAYSNPVVIAFDPSVNAQSANQVHSLSVGRTSTTVTIRWKLFQENGKKLRVYFHRADGGTAILLTPQGLPAGTTQYTLQYQTLASPCGYIDITQTATNGSNETGPSVGADLPGSRPSLVIDEGEPGCSGIPPEPPGPPPSSTLVTTFHHRDHLGSLRVVTDAAGWTIGAHDYYPFGREIEAIAADLSSGSTSRYTGHERDLATGLDYMVMRSKSPNYGFFTRPDAGLDVSLRSPSSWNSYSYVRLSSMGAIDPMGRQCVLVVSGFIVTNLISKASFKIVTDLQTVCSGIGFGGRRPETPADRRRRRLAELARQLKQQGVSDCQVLVNVVAAAVSQAEGEFLPANIVTQDLKAIFVGRGYTGESGAGDGPYYVPMGNDGFRSEFRDVNNQVRHVVGAFNMGNALGSTIGLAVMQGREHFPGGSESDMATNRAAVPIGAAMRGWTLASVADEPRRAVCESE